MTSALGGLRNAVEPGMLLSAGREARVRSNISLVRREKVVSDRLSHAPLQLAVPRDLNAPDLPMASGSSFRMQ